MKEGGRHHRNDSVAGDDDVGKKRLELVDGDVEQSIPESRFGGGKGWELVGEVWSVCTGYGGGDGREKPYWREALEPKSAIGRRARGRAKSEE